MSTTTWVPGWLARALAYHLPNDPVVTGARIVVVVAAMWLLYFAVSRRWSIGLDRRLIYGLIGVLSLLQEGEQLAFAAPFVLWRLPLLVLLQAACISSVRRYVSGRYAGKDVTPC